MITRYIKINFLVPPIMCYIFVAIFQIYFDHTGVGGIQIYIARTFQYEILACIKLNTFDFHIKDFHFL